MVKFSFFFFLHPSSLLSQLSSSPGVEQPVRFRWFITVITCFMGETQWCYGATGDTRGVCVTPGLWHRHCF